MDKANFRADDHSYWIGDRQIPSVTQTMRKHGLTADYSFVDEKTLAEAAEYGTFVHSEIENYIKNGVTGITAELQDFIRLAAEQGLSEMQSEEVVNNEMLAGTIDLISSTADGKSILADIKTTTTVHKTACSWQLSLYERLSGRTFDRFLVFHLCGKKPRVIEIERIPVDEVDRLLECERNGEIYAPKSVALPDDLLAAVEAAESAIKEADERKKEAEARAEAIRTQLREVMRETGVKSFENAAMKITYVEPSTREIIDQKRLRAELPELAREYTTTTTIKDSVRITLRD